MIENIRKQRADGKAILREGDAERSPSAATCAEEYKRHRRPSAGMSQHNMTKSRFPSAQGKWRGSASRRSHSYLGRVRRMAAPRSSWAQGRAVGGNPAGGVRRAVSRDRSNSKPTSRRAKPLSKIAGGLTLGEGSNVDRGGPHSAPGTFSAPAIAGPHGSSRGAEPGGLSKDSNA